VAKPIDDELTTHVADLLAPWCDIDARRMFGGIGLFAHGQMFAIIIDDDLYFKDWLDVDGKPVETDFEKEYFEYNRSGKMVRLGYFKTPERALEEGSYMIELARASYASASSRAKPRQKSIRTHKCAKPGRGR
jgi:DNA transformation protein